MHVHPAAFRNAASAFTSAGAISPAVWPLPPGVHTLSSTLDPPTRKTLGPSRRNNPMRSLFAAVNSGIVNDCFSYANPTKSEPKLPTLLVPTVIDAAVIAPTGTGCGVSAGVEGCVGCAPMEELVARTSAAPHPENIEPAATAAKPCNSRRRDRVRTHIPEPNP